MHARNADAVVVGRRQEDALPATHVNTVVSFPIAAREGSECVEFVCVHDVCIVEERKLEKIQTHKTCVCNSNCSTKAF